MPVELRKVTDDEADIRLDRWLRRHFPALTQSVIHKLCRTGQIRADGKRTEAADRLAPGMVIRIPPLPAPKTAPKPDLKPDPAAEAAAAKLVLYRDDQLLVLNKPFGLPTQGGPGITKHLDQMLTHLRFGSEHRPRLIHRLDRETTGVIAVARTPGIAAKLAAAFRSREVEKTYWALVAGRPVPVEGRIDLDLKRQGSRHGAHVSAATDEDDDAARAITDYRTLDHAGRRVSWLELRPLTGRTHQLRVHCAAIGAPILGDVKYGTLRNTDERGLRNTAVVPGDGISEGLHLHASRLDLPHPEGGRLVVEAPLPPHMQASFLSLGFAAPPPARPRRQ